MLIKGARVNNLKNVTIEIPRGKLVVITGISGSGKSSLAFDTLFAEGQRRFAESLSSYARQFLGRMTKPDVDAIEDIPPAIAIEQKVNIRNPRSTVATTTEVYDYLRLIFARIGRTYSPVSGREVRKEGVNDVIDYLKSLTDDGNSLPEPHYILAELGWKDRSDHTELLLALKEDGYNRLWTDGAPAKIEDVLQGKEPVDAIHKKLGHIMWEYVGMARNEAGLKKGIEEIRQLREYFWKNVCVPGTNEEFNQELEKALRLVDFFDIGELMARDALNRRESCGGHFREEMQTEEGETKRDDENFMYVAAWEYKGEGVEPELHKEPLKYENIKIATRNYKD